MQVVTPTHTPSYIALFTTSTNHGQAETLSMPAHNALAKDYLMCTEILFQ